MGRWSLLLLLAAMFAWPSAMHGQQQGRKYRIGILETVARAENARNFNALVDGLRELGYVEGQTFEFEYRSSGGRSELFPQLAAELAASKADVIVTRGTPAAQAAKEAAGDIPVVMAAIGEPLGAGLVADLAKPGGKVTGLSAFVMELAGKRVQLIREMKPATERLALMHNMANAAVPPQWEETKKAAQALRVDAVLLDVRSLGDIQKAFRDAPGSGIEIITVGIEGLFQANRGAIIALAEEHQLPVMYASREFVDEGGLISYGVSYPHLYFRAAGFVDKILKGAKAGDLPVEQPTTFEMIINLKTAKSLGFRLQDQFISRADEVIE
jgi:putative tryptophan/tyrosine transport system substrate-binding protein